MADPSTGVAALGHDFEERLLWSTMVWKSRSSWRVRPRRVGPSFDSTNVCACVARRRSEEPLRANQPDEAPSRSCSRPQISSRYRLFAVSMKKISRPTTRSTRRTGVVTYSCSPSENSMTITDPFRGARTRRPVTAREPRPSLRRTTSTIPMVASVLSASTAVSPFRFGTNLRSRRRGMCRTVA